MKRRQPLVNVTGGFKQQGIDLPDNALHLPQPTGVIPLSAVARFRATASQKKFLEYES